MCNPIKFLPAYICILFIAFTSCNQKPTPIVEKVVEVKKVQDINKVVKEELDNIFSKQLNESTVILLADTIRTLSFIKPIYETSSPFWTDRGIYRPLADTLLAIIKEARYFGLVPDDYHYSKLESLKRSSFNKKDRTCDAFAVAKTEMLLSDAYFKLGAHLSKGRFYPDSLLLAWRPEKLDSNWLRIMNQALKTEEIRASLDSLEPKHEGYRFLKAELKKYLIETQEMEWDSFPLENISDSTVKAQLRKRLLITCDYDSTARGNDSVKLSKAIKSFQKKMNLEPDGKLGKYTKQALAYSKEKMIRQIEMALERWRWEPKEFPHEYFWVNIPSADLHIWEFDTALKRDTLLLYSKVVVGKPDKQTPVLKSKINYMIIYPYWNVPRDIAIKEILPIVQRDTGYLRRKGFEVVGRKSKVLDYSTFNWKNYNKDYMPFKFRQRIGDENSLGICKFNFQNKYGVYMHDTNSKKYFTTFYRFQSHGCIRLEKFMETARLLTRYDTLKTPYDSLQSYFNTPVQRQIDIRTPVPIYVKYYTACADSTGLHMYIDIYRKDEQMTKLIYKNK